MLLFWRKALYLLLQSSSELPMCSLFLKKSTFLLYTIMCILHVECDCGMYVGDSIYISVVPPNYTYILCENSLPSLGTTHDAFFQLQIKCG